ncbi:hypothetical protein [Streptomyces collinus]|uniref:hypothetical protein n=1 Tax=Streptomyces collinus TaxID=42684 RepID=UPI0034462AA1
MKGTGSPANCSPGTPTASPALVRAVADGAFDAPGIDPLDFGLDRILDGVAALTTARE